LKLGHIHNALKRGRQGAIDTLLQPWFSILESIGLRRRVLWLDNCNWTEMEWRTIFTICPLMRLLYDFRSIRLNQLLLHGDLVGQHLPALSAQNYRDVSWEGYNLWALSKSGILASLETPTMEHCGERELRVIRYYYVNVAKLIGGSRWAINRYRPDTIILTQGCTPMARPLVEVARDCGIKCVATEGAFLRDYFFCDNATGMIVNRHRASRLDGDWLATRAFDAVAQKQFLKRYQAASSKKRPEHESAPDRAECGNLRESLQIPPGKKIAVFIGQVLTDASITMDSPHFPDPISLILRVFEFFKTQPDWTLVIRLHPKEESGVSWVNAWVNGIGIPPGEPKRPLPYANPTLSKLTAAGLKPIPGLCAIISGKTVDTQQLMGIADMGITINSQAGLEMLLQGKPVVVCGDAFYAHKGFTNDIGHPASLEPVLEYTCGHPQLSVGSHQKAMQFMDHMLSNVLFRRDLQGGWMRLASIMDSGHTSPLRRWIQRRMVNQLENRQFSEFGNVLSHDIAPRKHQGNPSKSSERI